ncbi:OmpA family protein [Rubellicoccus peritrichatus]|uniref:OmpA family protein n=1 Tax=Rubellicoccus peritrichatus TaxID=3080537 RepID=A0AAQ3LD57_9BACT|nr:OmpA family protein [Puniceicoccus sp. CR14]WOO43535.1 OmpA family protein [Puniceicoccus sp. CR14]
MKSLVKVSVALIGALLLLSGCSSDNGPTPADTVLNNPSRPTGWIPDGGLYNNPGSDTIGDGGIYSEDGDLLPGRDGAGGVALLGDGNEQILDVVYFGYDEYSIRPGERYKVEAAADFLRNNPGTTLIAEGHTDWKGTTQYNLGLGDRRANAVKDYLIQIGISPDRVEILSLGELEADQGLDKTDPEAINDRKVEMIVVGN